MKNHCHSCERHDNLKKCKYCNEYFCEEHLPAKMCLTPSVLNDKKTPAWIRTELEKEWRKEGGHPDTEYTSKRWKVFDRKEKIHDDSLIKLLDSAKTIHQPSLPSQKESSEKLKYETPFAPYPSRKSFRFPSNKIIILMIIFAVAAYFVFFASQETKNNISQSLEKYKVGLVESVHNATNNIFNSISLRKDTYYCDSNNATCMGIVKQLQNNCNNSITIVDYPDLTFKTDITRNEECRFYVTVEHSSLSGLKGTYMECNIPPQKAYMFSEDVSAIKYCEGSFKDQYYNLVYQFLGIGTR